MVCWNTVKPNQTQEERNREIDRNMDRIDALMASGQVTYALGPNGQPIFGGLTREQRDGLDDNCIYRRITERGSRAAIAAIDQVERSTGRVTDRNAHTHTHDGGRTWDRNHDTHTHGGRGGR